MMLVFIDSVKTHSAHLLIYCKIIASGLLCHFCQKPVLFSRTVVHHKFTTQLWARVTPLPLPLSSAHWNRL